jgi:chromosome segregation ATPase
MTNSNRYATVPIYAESLGHEVIRGNAISVGTLDPVAESDKRKRALDARERELDEREHVLDKREHNLIELDAALTAAKDKFRREQLITDATRKMQRPKRRMDALEEEEKAKYEEPITLPPGFTSDEGPQSFVADAGELKTERVTPLVSRP